MSSDGGTEVSTEAPEAPVEQEAAAPDVGAEQDAAPVDDGEAPVEQEVAAPEEPQIDPALMPDIQRLLLGAQQAQQAQQAPAFDPNTLRSAFAPVLEPVVQQNKALMDIIQNAAAQQKQAQLEASRPQPPPPDAPAADHLKYIHDNLKWEQSQATKGVESKIDQILKQFEVQQQAQQRTIQQQQWQAQQSRIEQAYTVGIQQLARNAQVPQMKVFENPDAAAALRAIHERIPHMSLPQVANLMLSAFGVVKTPASAAADRRTQEQAALNQRRQAVRSGGKPMPAGGNAAKSGPPPKGAREAAMLAMKHGARLNPDLLRSLNIDPNKVN